MMTKMTIKDLKNGYFVILRNGEMGMVQGEVIVMKKGFFYMDFEYEKYGDEEEDLTSIEDEDYDIMRVFRPESEGTRLEFGDFPEGYYGGEWIYNRDENWTPPTQKEREQKAAEEAAKRAAQQAEQDVAEEAAKRLHNRQNRMLPRKPPKGLQDRRNRMRSAKRMRKTSSGSSRRPSTETGPQPRSTERTWTDSSLDIFPICAGSMMKKSTGPSSAFRTPTTW